MERDNFEECALELTDGVPLQQGTIKKLTGGERWPVRTLFKGYFEFQPRAKTHMSGKSTFYQPIQNS
jgi:phage/plasmid-associated DNA primase